MSFPAVMILREATAAPAMMASMEMASIAQVRISVGTQQVEREHCVKLLKSKIYTYSPKLNLLLNILHNVRRVDVFSHFRY